MKIIRWVAALGVTIVMVTACVSPRSVSSIPTQISPSPQPVSVTLTAPQVMTLTPTRENTVTPTPTHTLTPLPSQTATISPTATLRPTPTWTIHPAGDVLAPILLYHHIADGFPGNRYYIDLKTFRLQMETLKQLGYTGITVSTLANVIINGGELPARPVIITFDDGDIDVYKNAYPIMKEYGFVGTFYIVVGAVDTYKIVTTDDLKEMVASGWEMGSHTMTHPDMRNPPNGLRWEAYTSRIQLQDKLGVPVTSFAYPFGLFDEFIAKKIKAYGYKSAVGLGNTNKHGMFDLFYLVRNEVQSDYDLTQFGKLLPWTDVPTDQFP